MMAALAFAATVAVRGYRPLYRGAGTPCPCCDHRGWLIGRAAAECARYGAALPLAPEVSRGQL